MPPPLSNSILFLVAFVAGVAAGRFVAPRAKPAAAVDCRHNATIADLRRQIAKLEFADREHKRTSDAAVVNGERLSAKLHALEAEIDHREWRLVTKDKIAAMRKIVHDIRSGQLHESGDEGADA